MNRLVCVLTIAVLAQRAHAQGADPAAPDSAAPPAEPSAPTAPVATPAPTTPAPATTTPAPAASAWAAAAADEEGSDSLQLHGWVSQGAMLSTGNDYLAHTKRGSFEFFEAGLNVTKELGSNLRAGVQLFAQDLGDVGNYKPVIDWAYVDYQLRPWLGFRVGKFKMPLFLYSEQLDADMSRTTVLQPQAVYDQHFREVLSSVAGLDVYGRVELGGAGSVDYDAYGGTLYVDLWGDKWDVENVYGSRVIWNTPVKCLRAAGHYQYANWHETEQLPDASRDGVIMTGAVPPNWDGKVTYNAKAWTIAGGGLECETDRMTFTAEASYWHSTISVTPALSMPYEYKQLRAYAQASFRVTDALSTSLYISSLRDESGGAKPSDDPNHTYDTAASVRYDVTPNFLVKAEAHYMDGYRNVLQDYDNAPAIDYASHWSLFLLKSTLAF